MKKNFLIFSILIMLVLPMILSFDSQIQGGFSFGDSQISIPFTFSDSEVNSIGGLDSVPPEVTIIYPTNSLTIANKTFDINFSLSTDTPTDSCFYSLEGEDSGFFASNSTISGCSNFSVTVNFDDYYELIVYSNDTFGNLGSDSVNFRVSSVAPAINIHHPQNNTWFKSGSDLVVNFTATDYEGIDICHLYTNSTGSWQINQTFNFVVSGIEENTTKNFADNNFFLFNVFCNDTLGSGTFANTKDNYTFYTDNILPNVSIITENNFNNPNSTFFFEYSIVDDSSLDSCSYDLYDSADTLLASNTSLDCDGNSTTLIIDATDTYEINIFGQDKAQNINSSKINFVINIPSTGGGGGGGFGGETRVPAIALIAPEGILYTTNLYRAIIYARISEECGLSGGQEDRECILSEEQRDDVIDKIISQGVNMDKASFESWFFQFKQGNIENVNIELSNVERFNLVTASVSIIKVPFRILSPANLDQIFIVGISSNEINVVPNKELKSCDIVGGDVGFSCIANGSSATVIFDIQQSVLDFTFKLYQAEIVFTTIQGDQVTQVFTLRVIRPTPQLVFALLLIGTGGTYAVRRRKQLDKWFKKSWKKVKKFFGF